MAVGFLSLPLELRTIIYNLVLVDPSTPHLRIYKPSQPFSYGDKYLHNEANLARLGKFMRRTRSFTKSILPWRPQNPHHTRTRISLLLVCQTIYREASPMYYGNNAWKVGIQGRDPSISLFTEFLNAIGIRNRGLIHTIIVLSRFGYSHLWKGPSKVWGRQVQRCQNLRTVVVAMAGVWAFPMAKRKAFWEEYCLEVWSRQIPSLESIQVWCQDYYGSASPLYGQRRVDDLLHELGLIPEGTVLNLDANQGS